MFRITYPTLGRINLPKILSACVMPAGLSNIITSLTGAGLTGSYIFSQTIFSMRAGVHTRIHGWIIACAALHPPHISSSTVL